MSSVPENVLKRMHPPNHKTIFLLDHTPFFGQNCEGVIEFDFAKPKNAKLIPLAPIVKSYWTCCVEAAIEYCRIVWDLFPSGKLIRFIVSDDKAQCLNTWGTTQQNLTLLLNNLANVGVPPSGSDDNESQSIFHGLKLAVQSMCEPTELQHAKRTSLDENAVPVVNRGRIICITSVQNNESVSILEERLRQEIVEGNRNAASSDVYLPIDYCEFVVLNIQLGPLENIPFHTVSSTISSETYHVKAHLGLPNKLAALILKHYDLASTTVTGIPMKEEQNASSSANYDVEIYHPSKAHEMLFKGSGVDMNQIRTLKEGMEYSTITLRWSTPRGCTASEMHNCTSTHRITPVDVNSRPSSCLINFLVGGRSVMLEVIRSNGTKALSHLLSSHGGQIYMHTLAVGRTLHDDPPSISEGIGGRVTDYRITDFGSFMQQNKLVPLKSGKGIGPTLKRTRPRIERHTKFWPMTISSTVIFNYRPHLEPILTLMLQPELRESDVNQCKQCIYSLVGNEAKHEPLPAIPSGQRIKGPKTSREEQYKQLWAELETFLRAHCVTDKHINILNCLLEVRNKDRSDGGDKVEIDQALKELDQLTNKSAERVSVIRATDSSLSTDSHTHRKSVLELWISKFYKQKPRQEFAGLATAQHLGNGRYKAKLYAHMKERTKSGTKAPRPQIME